MHHTITRIALSLIFLCLFSGCGQTGYYLQAAKGQYQILANRKPVSQILASESTPEDLRQQLQLAERMRQFAVEELGMRDSRSFTHYSDIGRRYVVWNVMAAPAYDLSPRTWCFPIAGCVSYKGFFDEEKALSEGDALRAAGYDVIVYGVRAYSTLGWFADPLMNTFIHFEESGLAALIFHELAHQLIYVQDDSAFNEAFATTVEISLVTRWLERHGSPEAVPALLERRRRQVGITKMVLRYRNRLAVAYRQEDREARKPALFAEMKREYGELSAAGLGTPFYDWWFQRELNNADLLSVSTYHRLVPAFQRLLEQSDQDYTTFLGKVRELAKLPRKERSTILARLVEDDKDSSSGL